MSLVREDPIKTEPNAETLNHSGLRDGTYEGESSVALKPFTCSLKMKKKKWPPDFQHG